MDGESGSLIDDDDARASGAGLKVPPVVRRAWDATKSWLWFDTGSMAVDRWLVFMQLYVAYAGLVFVGSEVETGFCTTRIILSTMYHDVLTSMPVGLTGFREEGEPGEPHATGVSWKKYALAELQCYAPRN
jgi:hypothetical protein